MDIPIWVLYGSYTWSLFYRWSFWLVLVFIRAASSTHGGGDVSILRISEAYRIRIGQNVFFDDSTKWRNLSWIDWLGTPYQGDKLQSFSGIYNWIIRFGFYGRYIWSLFYPLHPHMITLIWSFSRVLALTWSSLQEVLRFTWYLQIEPQAPLLVVPVRQYCKWVKPFAFKLAIMMFFLNVSIQEEVKL